LCFFFHLSPFLLSPSTSSSIYFSFPPFTLFHVSREMRKELNFFSSSQITRSLFIPTKGNCSRNKTNHSRVSVVRLHNAYCIGFITAVFLLLFDLMIGSVSLECSAVACLIQAPYGNLYFVTKYVGTKQLSVYRPLRVT